MAQLEKRTRWFLQFKKWPAAADLESLRKLGWFSKIEETSDSVPYPWLEMRSLIADENGMLDELHFRGLSDIVRKVVKVDRGEGSVLARQLELFSWE